jgi:C4-dicarboxylate-specific signal transduction histidine kinase
MAEGLNGRDAVSAMTAEAQVHEFLRSLESLADIEAMIPGQADAETIIRRAIEKVRQRCPAARFSVVAEARARLNGYVAEIESAVGFVLENAMESLEGGGEPIVVRVRAEGQSVSIEITDAGPGLDEASRRSLFMPFVSSKAGHHGLGLYFARMLVERNDGAIEIGAGEKGGVRARLLFPREGAS